MPRRLVVVKRWELAKVIGAHPSSLSVWLHQGLDLARLPGGFDLDVALEWLRETKRADFFKIDQAAVAQLRAVAVGVRTQQGGK